MKTDAGGYTGLGAPGEPVLSASAWCYGSVSSGAFSRASVSDGRRCFGAGPGCWARAQLVGWRILAHLCARLARRWRVVWRRLESRCWWRAGAWCRELLLRVVWRLTERRRSRREEALCRRAEDSKFSGAFSRSRVSRGCVQD